jgi:transcriptional regulator with XRE-family HTH domain
MRKIHDYLEAAREKNRFNTDADLARAMKISVSSVSNFRRGIAFPDDENMVNLARLGGLDEQVALVELSFWRAGGEAKSTYEKILKRISAFLPATLFGLAAFHPDTAQAAGIIANKAASLPHSGIAESVSQVAIIMYITENTITNDFNKASQKQTLNNPVAKCVSRTKVRHDTLSPEFKK